MNSQEKGNLLEEVVESIERFLLSQNPGIAFHNLSIERKKRIIIDEVLHEIDLYIQIDMGNGYVAVYIFECKNWKTNIDKNEIIVFSEKIRATNAAKGFFIARGFTTYAISQSKKDTRIELVTATEEFDKFPYATAADSFNQELKHLDISLFEPNNTISLALDITNDNVSLDGKKIDLTEFTKKTAEDFVARKYGKAFIPTTLQIVEGPDNNPATDILGIGNHSFIDRVSFHFPQDLVLKVNETVISKIHLAIHHQVQIIAPVVLWQYDVEKRGRVGYFRYNTPAGDFITKMTGQEGAAFVHVEVKQENK